MSYALDPELAAAAAQMPEIEFTDPLAARRRSDELRESRAVEVDVSGLVVEDRLVPGAPGEPPVAVRVYQPRSHDDGRPALIQLHGGAFVAGDLEADHAVSARNAAQLQATVVAVNYRLAPEHPFPAGLEDCYAALRWLHEEADTFGVDRERIGVSGQSAGGGMAAGLALLARDRCGPMLCFQFLAMAELDDRLDTPSARAFVDTPQWSRPKAEVSWRCYLRGHAGPVSPYAAPARAIDLAGLPPAYISAAEFDPFRDEDVAYALALLRANVSAELHVYPGTFHGSETSVWQAAISRRQQADSLAALRRGLSVPSAHVALPGAHR